MTSHFYFFIALLSTVAVAVAELKGIGGTAAENLVQGLLPTLNKRYKVQISCLIDSSENSKKKFIAGKAHYALSEFPLSSSEEQSLRGEKKLTLPVALQTFSIFTYIPQNSQPLKFSPIVLAQIFTGQIKTWDHEAILASNPSLVVPPGQSIFVVRRKDSCSATRMLSQWLHATSGGLWTLGVDSEISWPTTFLSGKGSAGVGATMHSSPFSIGYLNTKTGIEMGLIESLIPNRFGTYLTAKTANPYGALPSTLPARTASWSSLNLLDRPGKRTWPLSSFILVLAKQNVVSMGQSGGLLKSFLKYLNSDSIQGLLVEFNLLKLPKIIISDNRKAIGSLKLARGVNPPF